MSDENVVPLRNCIAETPEQAAARATLPKISDPRILAAMDVLEEWSAERLRSGQEPPWEWYRLMQFRDAMFGLRGPAPGEIEVNLP